MALIQLFAEAHDLQRSQALRRLLDIAEATLDGEARRDLAVRRAALAKEAKVAVASAPPKPRCPNCGEADLYLEFPDGRWRCDACLGAG